MKGVANCQSVMSKQMSFNGSLQEYQVLTMQDASRRGCVRKGDVPDTSSVDCVKPVWRTNRYILEFMGGVLRQQ